MHAKVFCENPWPHTWQTKLYPGGAIKNGVLYGDNLEVKHSDEYVSVNDERLTEADELALALPVGIGRHVKVGLALDPFRVFRASPGNDVFGRMNRTAAIVVSHCPGTAIF